MAGEAAGGWDVAGPDAGSGVGEHGGGDAVAVHFGEGLFDGPWLGAGDRLFPEIGNDVVVDVDQAEFPALGLSFEERHGGQGGEELAAGGSGHKKRPGR